MHAARYSLSQVPSELERVTCSDAILIYFKEKNINPKWFILRDLNKKEILEIEKDWRTAAY